MQVVQICLGDGPNAKGIRAHEQMAEGLPGGCSLEVQTPLAEVLGEQRLFRAVSYLC